MTVIFAWLAIWWYPLAMAGVLWVLVWHHVQYAKWYSSDEAVKARQKADYERAHAHTNGKCPDRD